MLIVGAVVLLLSMSSILKSQKVYYHSRLLPQNLLGLAKSSSEYIPYTYIPSPTYPHLPTSFELTYIPVPYILLVS